MIRHIGTDELFEGAPHLSVAKLERFGREGLWGPDDFAAHGIYWMTDPEPEPLPEPEPARPMVRKSIVQARLIDAGKMDEAYAILIGNPEYFARWFAPDRPEVYCDDPDAVLVVTMLGLDPEIILAVEIGE